MEREVSRRTEELQEALATQTMLVHEVDHRVKNNIQMISALLSHASGRNPGSGRTRRRSTSMLQRVESIGAVHRRLYQSKDVRRFDLAEFVRDVSGELLKLSGRADIELVLELESVHVPSQQASPISLMLNELITNALKHAFPNGRPGRLSVKVGSQADRMLLVVMDDGVGLVQGSGGETGFGRRLIRTIARQLHAEVTWKPGAPGTIVGISLPLPQVVPLPPISKDSS